MIKGLIIITHESVGHSLLEVAEKILPNPLPTKVISIQPDQDKNEAIEQAEPFLHKHAKQVLILTDLYGATPSNVSFQIAHEYQLTVLSGINLAMLLTIFNHPKLSLSALIEKAIAAARESIVENSNTR